MTCEEFVELISTYFDAVLAPEQEVLFMEHLRSCPPCAVCLEQFRLTARILADITSPATMPWERREYLVAAFLSARS